MDSGEDGGDPRAVDMQTHGQQEHVGHAPTPRGSVTGTRCVGLCPCRYMDSRGMWGMTPLHVAVLREDIECVRALLEAGVKLSIPTAGDCQMNPVTPIPAGCTSLHIAAVRNNVGIIQTLLQVGSQIDASGSNSRSHHQMS